MQVTNQRENQIPFLHVPACFSGCDEHAHKTVSTVVAIISISNSMPSLHQTIKQIQCRVSGIIVITDGSVNHTTITELQQIENVEIITYSKRQGKGHALQRALEKACCYGFTHAVTAEGNGQYLADIVDIFVDKISDRPAALWVGRRQFHYDKELSEPVFSNIGNMFSSLLYRLTTGVTLHDPQCAFCAFPIVSVLPLLCRSKRYGYEQHILIQAAWKAIEIKETTIQLPYHGSVVPFFESVRNSFGAGCCYVKAVFARICIPPHILKVSGRSWRDRIIAVIKSELKNNTAPQKAAQSIAFGVFMGIFPIHGFQVITLMALTFLFHLNRPLAFVGVCVSSPPFLPFLALVTIALGRLILPEQIITLSAPEFMQKILQGAAEFFIGSVVLSIVAGISTYWLAYPVFKKLARIRCLER